MCLAGDVQALLEDEHLGAALANLSVGVSGGLRAVVRLATVEADFTEGLT